VVEHIEGPIKREFFVAHAYTEDKEDLRSAIQTALCGHFDGIRPYYADNEVRSGQIFLNKIIPKMRSTEFGIYDISTRNPNVLLELGAAMMLNILNGVPEFKRKPEEVGGTKLQEKGYWDYRVSLRL